MLAFTFVHDENWPFKSTLCWRFFKKSIKMHNSLSFMSFRFCFNLCISLSRHTLSTALDMSRNTLFTSKPLSKEVKISRVIDRSWFTHESPRETGQRLLMFCLLLGISNMRILIMSWAWALLGSSLQITYLIPSYMNSIFNRYWSVLILVDEGRALLFSTIEHCFAKKKN